VKRIGYLSEELCSFQNLHKAFRRAFGASGRHQEACEFHFHLEKELFRLKEELEDNTYQPSPYRYFEISDPKKRTISVAPFRDRIVHHALVGILEPVFEKRFIYDSYATRKEKGTHKAIRRAQEFMKKNYFFLKTDVAKYFDSISHDILMELLRTKIKDENVLILAERIIRNSDTSREIQEGVGLPIGNLTSQFFANVYLDPQDHYMKDKLGVKYYIRYMDDMVMFSDSRNELKSLLKQMRFFLRDRLKLVLKERVTQINTRLHGLPFLGFRVFPNLLRIRQENFRRLKGRMRQREKEFENGLISEETFVMSVRSMFEHIGFADSLNLRRSLS